jgi:hypothetical protein
MSFGSPEDKVSVFLVHHSFMSGLDGHKRSKVQAPNDVPYCMDDEQVVSHPNSFA